MRFSSWWDETAWDETAWDGRLRVDLAEVMDELDPGWAEWRARAPEPAAVG